MILTSIFYGSELLYPTDHQVLTGPYHRNDAAILDTYDALTTPDDDVALSIVIWPNLIALVLLAPVVVKETRSYFDRRPWERHATGGGD